MSRYQSRYTYCLIMIVAAWFTSCTQKDAPDDNKHIVVATMGASLMSPSNGWVEMACEQLHVTCLNKAVSSRMPWHFAQELYKNEYATQKELAAIDILLIQFANCYDVHGDPAKLLPTADDYTRNYSESSDEMFQEYSYAQQIDYILKKWQEICEQYKKPMHVIFVTHWHDGRVVYNKSVRMLAQRWNADVCELDKHIGFSKNQPLSDGSQPSILYAKDTEEINGVIYGWHPLRGEKGKYIQSKMASILYDKLDEYIKTNNVN